MTTAIITQVAELPTLPTPKLKAMWRELTGTEPPPYNRTFVIPAQRRAHQTRQRAATRSGSGGMAWATAAPSLEPR
jgi:hypothetical protein